MPAPGYSPEVVQVSGELKQALRQRTGESSVPQVFVKGTFIGGCNDGGLGGTLLLLKNGKLKEMMEETGEAEASDGGKEFGKEAAEKKPRKTSLAEHIQAADIVVLSHS